MLVNTGGYASKIKGWEGEERKRKGREGEETKIRGGRELKYGGLHGCLG